MECQSKITGALHGPIGGRKKKKRRKEIPLNGNKTGLDLNGRTARLSEEIRSPGEAWSG